MLLVRVALGPSPLHGTGVFAAEPITAGTVVWRFSPGFDLEMDPALVYVQPEPCRGRLLHYGYVDARSRRYVLCSDDARFLNHSDAPNLRGELGRDVAVRDIAPGEELTVDYGVVEGARPG
jgi:hypothetical protein